MSKVFYDRCPHCDGNIPVRQWMEWHPYGDGSAAEVHCEVLPCRDCGYGEEGWKADEEESE